MSYDPKRTPIWMAVYNQLSPWASSQGEAESMTDAVMGLVTDEPVTRVTDNEETYYIEGHNEDEAKSSFGSHVGVRFGYFVEVSK